MKTIFIDECGYTGEDLANPEQPIFTIATHAFSEERCLELKRKFFGDWGDDEIKHALVRSDPRLSEAAIRLFEEVSTEEKEVQIGAVHKQFALVTKMVDMLVEPAMYADGVNLYENGGHIALSNMLFHTYRLGGEEFLQRLTKKFQNLMRRKNAEEYRRFFEFVHKRHPVQLVDESLRWLRAAHARLGPEGILDGVPSNSLDVSLTLTLSVMARWRSMTNDDLTVIHDRSTNMAKQKKFWDTLTSPNIEPVSGGSGTRKFTLPVAVSETRFEPAAQWAALQVADLLAGASAHIAKRALPSTKDPRNSKYGEALDVIFAKSFGGHTIWPTDKISPDELGTAGTDGQELLNSVIELMRGKGDR